MSLNLVNNVIKFLTDHPEQKFTARQIAEWIFITFPNECQNKLQNSQCINTNAELMNQIISEIGARRPLIPPRCSGFKTTEGKPRKYYYSEKTDIDEVEAMTAKANIKTGEHALYKLLPDYLYNELGIYSKRIDEKCSSNKRGPNGNRWLYPDIVGVEDLSADWHQEIKNCVNHYSDRRTKLWSFEVKLLINRSNVRECFFQTVSNSSGLKSTGILLIV